MSESSENPESTVASLRQLRGLMLKLHKTLLDMERADFERDFGRLTSGELLQLVINHAQFAWLRKISALIVEIDEALSDKEPATEARLQGLVEQVRQLFTSPADLDFKDKYQAMRQREPAVATAHAELLRLLPPA